MSPGQGRRPREWWDGADAASRGFLACAALALALHAALAFGRSGLWGGGDLLPHLRLIEQTTESPGLHNPYAPAYHLLGALVSPWLGPVLYTRLFSLLAALLLIAGFRSFQRAAGLPDAASALFALNPYLLSLSYCTPKVEVAGYGLMLLGLGGLLRGQRVAVAILVAASFATHTASALLFGLLGGVLCLARRDGPGLAALASGALLATPLVAAHVTAGCSFREALLFAPGGYARGLQERLVPPSWPWLAPLANPIALLAGLLGAGLTWRRSRALGILCLAMLALYASNLWLAPFGIRTLVTPLRGLSLLAIPVSISAGLFASREPRLRAWVVGLSAAYAVVALVAVVPHACYVRSISLSEVEGLRVQRCAFLWRRPRPPVALPRGARP